MRRVMLAVATLVAVIVLIPLRVLATVAMGLPARHWSGAHLNDIRWNGDGNVGGRQPAGLFDDPSVLERQDRITDEVMVSHGPSRPRVVEVDTEVNCVRVVTVRLDNELFDQLGRYGDGTCVVYSPNEGIRYQDSGGTSAAPRPSTYLDWWNLVGTYWVLLTGFPLHIGAILLLAVLAWTVPMSLARRRAYPPPPAPDPQPAEN